MQGDYSDNSFVPRSPASILHCVGSDNIAHSHLAFPINSARRADLYAFCFITLGRVNVLQSDNNSISMIQTGKKKKKKNNHNRFTENCFEHTNSPILCAKNGEENQTYISYYKSQCYTRFPKKSSFPDQGSHFSGLCQSHSKQLSCCPSFSQCQAQKWSFRKNTWALNKSE